MGRIRAFDIVTDNNALSQVDGLPVFSPGNQVTGVVNLHLNTSRDDVRVITISLRGRAQTRWSEMLTRTRSGSVADHQRVTFTGTETYVDYNLPLWQQEHPHQKLHPGLHSFPFEFRLPLINLPSDYEGASGHVRYRLKCEIVGDSPLSNAKVERKIAIAGCPLDLNCIHDAMVPVHGQSESLLSYWCCITGTVTTRASTDKRAYMPGETAYITAFVQGSSGARYDVLIKLVQEATFRGTGSTYSSSGVTVETRTNRTCQRYRVLARKKTSGVLQRRGETTLQREPMIIPDNVLDTGFEGCNIIDINYFINVAPLVSNVFRAIDTEVRLPVSIGRIPFTALPSYLATTSHLGLPAEPPPSYATATSSSLNVTSLDQSNTSFAINQAYSPELELSRLNSSRDENEPVLSIPPTTSNNHVSDSFHGDTSLEQIDGGPSMTIQPDVHGIENVAFSSDSQVDDNSALGEHLSMNVDDEDELLGTITPPTMFSSPVNTFPESQISLENDWYTEVTAQVSDDVMTSRNSQRDTNSQDGELDDSYFLPAYDDQSFSRDDMFIEETDIQESDLQPILRLQSFFEPIGDSVIDQRTSSRGTLPPPSPWKDDHPAGFDHKCQHVMEKAATTPSQSQLTSSTVAKTRAWKDYVLLSERNDTHKEGAVAGDQHVAEGEVHFEPVNLTLGKNKKSVDDPATRNCMPSLEFSLAAASTRDSRGGNNEPELNDGVDNKQRLKKRHTSLLKDTGLRNIDLVLDNPQLQSRTPSPYFHPEDQRDAMEDVASVSSFGSYSASSHIPRERRLTPRLQEHTRSKSHDRSRDGALPLFKQPRESLKHSEYYGSLDRQRRPGRRPTSAPIPERGGGSCDRHKWSTPTFDASTVNQRRRDGSQKFQHTSIPKIDRPNTNSYRKFEDNKTSPSRRPVTPDSDTAARQIVPDLHVRSHSSPRLKSSTQKKPRGQSAERDTHKQFPNPNFENCQTVDEERTSFPPAVERALQEEESSGTRETEPSSTRHYLWKFLNNRSPKTQAQRGQDDHDSRAPSPPDKQRFETFV